MLLLAWTIEKCIHMWSCDALVDTVFYHQNSAEDLWTLVIFHSTHHWGGRSEYRLQTEWPAHLLQEWWIVTSGLQAPDPLLIVGSSSPQHMRKMCALYMTPGNVCLETSDQHKILNATTVDHRSMWRATQIQTYILSHPWTWVTSRNATHRTPRSPSPITMVFSLFSTRNPQELFLHQPESQPCQLVKHRMSILFLNSGPYQPQPLLHPLQLTSKKRSWTPGSKMFPFSLGSCFSSHKIVMLFMWTGLMQSFLKICWHLMLRYNLMTLSTGHRRLQS